MRIRLAKPDERELLDALAFRSKAHWGYDDDFMEKCREALCVKAEQIERGDVKVLVTRDGIVGFFCLCRDGNKAWLDALFVDPGFMGLGYGKALFRAAAKHAARRGIGSFTIDADPFARGFYEKMGATCVGTVESTVVANRMLPLMEYTIV